MTSADASTKGLSIALCLAFATVTLDATALNVALPSLAKDFDVSINGLQWVVNAYTLTFAVFMVSAGRWHDQVGPRQGVLTGSVAFAASSLVCAFAPNVTVLIVARLVQGVAGSLVVTGAFALMAYAFSDPHQRAKSLSAMNSSGTLALFAGPVVGGALVDAVGWQAIFLANPIITFVIWLALRNISDRDAIEPRHFDVPGQVLCVVVLGALAFTLIEGPVLGWSSTTVIVSMIVVVAAAVSFVVVERRQPDAIVPARLLRIRTFSSSAVASAGWTMSLFGLIFVLGIYFQNVEGMSPSKAGLAFLPFLAAPLIPNLLAGKLLRRFDVTRTTAAALFVSGLGAAGVAVSSDPTYLHLALCLCVMAGAAGLAIPGLSLRALSEVPRTISGTAAGVLNGARGTGSLVGVAVFGPLAGVGSTGYVQAPATIAALVLLTGVVVVLVSGRSRAGREPVAEPLA